MFNSAYPFTLISAILLSALMLTSCGNENKKDTIHINQQKEAQQKEDAQAKAEKEQNIKQKASIDALVEQARLEDPYTDALDELLTLSQDSTLTTENQGLAALKRAELLFEFEQPDAFEVCQATIQQWPEHPYLPHVYLTLAEQWLLQENLEDTMNELTQALYQPQIDSYTVADDIELATPLLDSVSQQTSLEWLLAVSKHDVEHQDFWLRQAAKVASLEFVLQLRQSEHPLTQEQSDFYRYFARERLMVGDYHAVRLVARILELDMPNTDTYEIVQRWAKNEREHTIIGVLLPLTGKYANYGKQALEGIRLAMSQPDFEDSVTLFIQDTAGKPEQAVSAYHQLLSQGAEWVLGPLLSNNTKALLPYLTDKIPVIALSSQTQSAAESPNLFIHSLSKTVQAEFMARHAIQSEKLKTVILYGYTHSETEEAAAFAQTLMDNGGEVADIVELKRGVYDNRPDLVAMRSRTDDEALLVILDEDLQLFEPERKMDIKMPLNFDAVYIAAPGKKVAVLAGQLAYADIRHTQLYGSYRWADGHLVDDDGRYLNHAQFATPATSLSQPNQAVLDVKSQYRIIWEKPDISPLFAVAYDTAMNIASIGSRLGLKGKDALNALQTTTEFPAITGHYYFDKDGVSQKTFALQTIRKGRIEAVQLSQ